MIYSANETNFQRDVNLSYDDNGTRSSAVFVLSTEAHRRDFRLYFIIDRPLLKNEKLDCNVRTVYYGRARFFSDVSFDNGRVCQRRVCDCSVAQLETRSETMPGRRIEIKKP